MELKRLIRKERATEYYFFSGKRILKICPFKGG